MKFRGRILAILFLAFFLGNLVWTETLLASEITGVRVEELKEKSKVLILSDAPVKYSCFKLTGPPRLRIHLSGAQLTWEEKRITGEGMIRKIEAVQYHREPDIVRVDIHLAYSTDFNAYQEEEGLVLELAKKEEIRPTTKREEAKKHYKLGKRHYKKREFEEAITEFQRALALDPEWKEARNYLLRAEEGMKEEREKEKVRLYLSQELARKEAIERCYQQGKREYKKGGWQKAQEHFLKVLAINPDHKGANKYLAEVQRILKKEEEVGVIPEVTVKIPTIEVPVLEPKVSIEEVRIRELPYEIEVIITGNKPFEYSSFTLEDPPRLVVDIIDAKLEWPEKELIVDRGNLKRIHSSQYSAEPLTARLVLDLTQLGGYELIKKGKELMVAIATTPRGKILPPEKEREVKKKIVGVGDLLFISVWPLEELSSIERVVYSDGTISFPLIGKLKVEGLTPLEVERKLTKELIPYIQEPQVAVAIKVPAPKMISIFGALDEPGLYPFPEEPTVIEALARASGGLPITSYKRVIVRRKGGQVIPINLREIIYQGDESQNILLHEGDMVYVTRMLEEERLRAYLFGEVKVPGRYYIEENETILEAIAKARGFTNDAVQKGVILVRGDLSEPQLRKVDLYSVTHYGKLENNIPLQSGDIVYVPRRPIASFNYFLNQILPTLRTVIMTDRFLEVME